MHVIKAAVAGAVEDRMVGYKCWLSGRSVPSLVFVLLTWYRWYNSFWSDTGPTAELAMAFIIQPWITIMKTKVIFLYVKLICSSSMMGMKNIWRNMMERPTTTRPVLFPSVGCWDICICCCEGYRWRQMGLNIIDMLLCGRAVSDTGAWERGPTIQYLLPQIKMTQHPISILFY